MSAMTHTATRSGLTAGGILRSETIKLFTVRSTIWCLAIVVVISIGLGFLLAATLNAGPTPLAAEQQQGFWLQCATVGVGFSQLVVAVLGVLVISGEYSTGMIRSTFTSVPGRVSALGAKAVVIGVTTFLVGGVAVIGAAILPSGLLPAAGIEPDFGEPRIWLALLGAAVYLGLLAVLSLSIGAIVRNSAGGIATALGLILVLPTVLGLFAVITGAQWAQNISVFLPSEAGSRMFAFVNELQEAAPGTILLDPWQGTLVMVAWVAVFLTIAGVLIKRRDA